MSKVFIKNEEDVGGKNLTVYTLDTAGKLVGTMTLVPGAEAHTEVLMGQQVINLGEG